MRAVEAENGRINGPVVRAIAAKADLSGLCVWGGGVWSLKVLFRDF